MIVTVILPRCESDASNAIGLPMFAMMCGYVTWSYSLANVWYHAESGRRLFGHAKVPVLVFVSARTITCCPTATVRAPIESTVVQLPPSDVRTYTLFTVPTVCDTGTIEALSGALRPPCARAFAQATLGLPKRAKICRFDSSMAE